MKKLLLLFALMLTSVGAWAQLVQTSTEESPVYYVIASYNRGGVITYTDVDGAVTHSDYTNDGKSTWYFEAVPNNENNGVYIVSKNKNEENKVYLDSDKKASATPAVWYIVENGVNSNGYSISSVNPISGYSCLDAYSANTSIGSYFPSSNDWQGTTWVFFKESELKDATYNPNGWVTRAGTGGRYIKSITINGVTQSTTPYYGLVYFDLTKSVKFNVLAGSDVAISIDRAGNWMHSYAYVDEDADGFTDTDAVTYSYYNGKNSAEVDLSSNSNTVVMPNFTAPETTGEYRMRVKYDWDDLDPNGADGKINNAGGVFVDVILNVVSANQMATVTYNYVYEGVQKYQETVEVLVGSEYPEYTQTFPYGIVAETKPTGTVEGDVTEEITLTADLPFKLSTLTDGKFAEGMSWYYLKMRSKDVTYDATTNKALTGNVEEKTNSNLFAFTGNPFDGYSIYNYVAGANKVFWREDDTNGGRVFFTNKTETDGNTWILSANGTSGYVFRLNGYTNGYMNDHQPDIAIWNHSWGATDGGSTFTFEYVEDPDLTILYDITYEYVYNDVVKATQTTTVESGAEYPEIGYFAPYGVTVGVKPEGTVSATGTHQITLTVEKELPFKTATDVASIDTWYYAQMHKNSSVTAYIQDTNDGTNIEWADKTVDATEIETHLWGYVGDVWTGIKVVNKATGRAIVSTSGDAVLGNAANATALIPTLSNGDISSDWFCLKYPNNSNYLNAQGEKISSWSDADNGSSFFLTEYTEAEVSVSAADYATLYLGQATYIPEGVEVYTVTATANGYATLTAVEEVLPANTGVILKNAGTYTFKTAGATGSAEGNLLQGSVEDIYVAGPAYVLSNGTAGVGLYKATLNKDAEGAEGDTHFLNNANKAYLPATTSEARFLVFDFGGETAIENIEGVENATDAVVYDLAGRRVQNAQKGLYIVNGKKVVK